jgi:hypothetical protein
MDKVRLQELAGVVTEGEVEKHSFISEHKFRLLAKYEGHKGEEPRKGKDTKSIRRFSVALDLGRKNLVYAMFIGDDLVYVGKTIAGPGRPLSYHKNDVMKNVRGGLEKATAEGLTVEVYAKSTNLVVEHEGLKLNIVEAFEQALISKYNPEWNSAVQQAIG